jgi:cytidyltransferase-like protein
MIETQKERIIVAVSGGFDPVHIGHVRMFRESKALGDELVVLLNNDNWLMKKKGYIFMPQEERKEILEALEVVDRVLFTSHKEDAADMSVCEDLRMLKPHVFANGGDRLADNVPEVIVCNQLGCRMVFNVGKGGKVQSSSWLVEKNKERNAEA